jgi:predicted peroxiredoxin
MPRKLVVRITHGEDDAERAAQGLTVAAAAVASGVTTEVWLTNEAVALAVQGVVERMDVPHSSPPAELWAHVSAAATMYACTPCLKRRDIDAQTLRDGVQPAGATGLVASVLEDGTKELSF